LKAWQLKHRVNSLSEELADPINTETKLVFSSFSEPERQLLDRVQEIVDKYAPAVPPKDVIEKNADLWYKGLEIFGRRVTQLFVEIVPDAFLCDELEEWYFKLYFYNFWLDWRENMEKLREMPKEQHDALLLERREKRLLDVVFRFPKSKPETSKQNKRARCHEQ
jgi:hypothetical protein